MTKLPRAIELIDDSIRDGLAHGVLQLALEDEKLDGQTIRVAGRTLLQFASCSYLGLELDSRVREGAADALARYGTQFSCSRSYLSAPAYEELESLLERIFERPVLVSPSTTLGHLSALPVLVEEDDAVIFDHQVHQSVQIATAQLRLQGNPVEIVRHGQLDMLEAKIRELAPSHRRIWYLGDGVYSMYGDFAPMKGLSWLLSRYEQLHLYVDDAHGMSWTGRRGRGFAAESLGGHERVVIAVSLNKAFAAAGGAIVLPNAEIRQKIRNCGPTLMFGGPIQPPMLGAAVASAKIHLSPEIEILQAELATRVKFANRCARELDLPLVNHDEVPIRYVGTGVRGAAYHLTAGLLERGVCMNAAVFPAVASRRTGIRFTITRHLAEADIRKGLEAVAELLPATLAAAGLAREDVDLAFGIGSTRRAAPRPEPSSLSLRHARSIRELDADEWNACLAGRGIFDAATLATLEAVFGPHQPPESRWGFHYFIVRDAEGRIVLATFFTEGLWKDDLMAKASVSEKVEELRAQDPYYLTSHTLSMGSLLTEGDHMFLDRRGDWRAALRLLLAGLEEIRAESEAPTLILRDLDPGDEELSEFLKDMDFLRIPAPDTWVAEVTWSGQEEFLAGLASHERRFHRRQVLPFADRWELEILRAGSRAVDAAEWAHLYGLYRNVQQRQLAINSFPLPPELLPRLLETGGWELLLLRLRAEHGGDPAGAAQGFVACRAGAARYDWLLVGMDYDYVESQGLYRQLVAHVVRRAESLGLHEIGMGMGSERVKKRFRGRPHQRVMYVQSMDRYNQDLLGLVAPDPD